MSYRFIKSGPHQTIVLQRDDETIPLNLDNTDCAKFLQDWKDGAEVLDADGNPLPYSDEALASFGINHGH
jgi:hypothetical protein